VLVAPAMNTNMLEHPATQENLAALRRRGVHVVDPGEGFLACGWTGKGRLAEPDEIVDAAEAVLRPSTAWAGRHVVVSAGPTYEDVDPVRYLGNRSSGRMGVALAAEAARRGARVTLVLGPSAQAPPPQVEVVKVRSAADMHAAMFDAAPRADVIIMAAAVADYTPAGGAQPQKVAKSDGDLVLRLVRTRDVLADLGAWRGDRPTPILVGFAAETDDVVAKARAKRAQKRVDLIVANDVSRADAGFDVDTNAVTLVDGTGDEVVPTARKTVVAARILDRVERLFPS
jgi:phosphopantothenoylcysteine decarboxylase/phosphopantothenate--cysteine ligase